METNPVLDEIRRLCEERQTGLLLLSDAQGERISVSFCEGLIEAPLPAGGPAAWGTTW